MLSKAPWRSTEEEEIRRLPLLLYSSQVSQPPVRLPNFHGVWEPHGRFWNPMEIHLQKQGSYPDTKPPMKKFGNCSSIPFPIWRDILTVDTREVWFKTSRLSLARTLYVLHPWMDIHLVNTSACGHWHPKQLLFQALESQACVCLSLPVLLPRSACWQKVLPWKAKSTDCNDKAAQNNLGTTNRKPMLPSK